MSAKQTENGTVNCFVWVGSFKNEMDEGVSCITPGAESLFTFFVALVLLLETTVQSIQRLLFIQRSPTRKSYTSGNPCSPSTLAPILPLIFGIRNFSWTLSRVYVILLDHQRRESVEPQVALVSLTQSPLCSHSFYSVYLSGSDQEPTGIGTFRDVVKPG